VVKYLLIESKHRVQRNNFEISDIEYALQQKISILK
ncbi:hypothetical protein SS7213T_03265, partial [Staphylococcus simiae CCM 7213 = CCUG 51256]